VRRRVRVRVGRATATAACPFSVLAGSRGNRLSRIFSPTMSGDFEWSKEPEQSAVSFSMNQVVAVQVLATSRGAVRQPWAGAKPVGTGRRVAHREPFLGDTSCFSAKARPPSSGR
jgi:hypothetical protein